MKKQEVEFRFQWNRAMIAVLFYALLFTIAALAQLDLGRFAMTAAPSLPAAIFGIFLANKREN